MSKSRNDGLGFYFINLVTLDKYKTWVQEMRYSLKSTRLSHNPPPNTKNLKTAPIILKDEDPNNDIKLKCQEK